MPPLHPRNIVGHNSFDQLLRGLGLGGGLQQAGLLDGVQRRVLQELEKFNKERRAATQKTRRYLDGRWNEITGGRLQRREAGSETGVGWTNMVFGGIAAASGVFAAATSYITCLMKRDSMRDRRNRRDVELEDRATEAADRATEATDRAAEAQRTHQLIEQQAKELERLKKLEQSYQQRVEQLEQRLDGLDKWQADLGSWEERLHSMDRKQEGERERELSHREPDGPELRHGQPPGPESSCISKPGKKRKHVAATPGPSEDKGATQSFTALEQEATEGGNQVQKQLFPRTTLQPPENSTGKLNEESAATAVEEEAVVRLQEVH